MKGTSRHSLQKNRKRIFGLDRAKVHSENVNTNFTTSNKNKRFIRQVVVSVKFHVLFHLRNLCCPKEIGIQMHTIRQLQIKLSVQTIRWVLHEKINFNLGHF